MNDVFLFLVCFSKGVSIPLEPRRDIPHIIPQALPRVFWVLFFFLFFFLSFGTVDTPIWTAVGVGRKRVLLVVSKKFTWLIYLWCVVYFEMKSRKHPCMFSTTLGIGPHPLFKRAWKWWPDRNSPTDFCFLTNCPMLKPDGHPFLEWLAINWILNQIFT